MHLPWRIWLLVFMLSGFHLSRAQEVFAPLDEHSGMQWVENKGQFHPDVKFRARLEGGHVFAGANGISFHLFQPEDHAHYLDLLHHKRGKQEEIKYRTHAFRMSFGEGFQAAMPEGKLPYRFTNNFFIGNDPSHWASDVNVYGQLVYENLFPQTDLRLYLSSEQLKLDWVVKPGGDPSKISWIAEGVDWIKTDGGSVLMGLSTGEVKEFIPEAYQYINGIKQQVKCLYLLEKHTVRFSVEDYDQSRPLIIDPVLVFATYSGSKGDNFGYTATYDSKGNLYAGGITDGSTADYPVTTGAFQTTFGGGQGLFPANLACDISISKYDSSGSNLLYATYLGGRYDDYPHSLVVDNQDNLLVYGTTYSDNFATTTNAYQRQRNGMNDIIVSKLSANGSQLLASTYMGGSGRDGLNGHSSSSVNDNPLRYNYADDFRGDIIVDVEGRIWVASCTNSDDFPTTSGASQTAFGGKQDGCLFGLSSDMKDLIMSTYLGGTEHDALYTIDLDEQGNIFTAGGTRSANLPTHSTAFGGRSTGVDGVVAKYRHDNFKLSRLSYYGSLSYEQIYFIEIDRHNKVFLAGQTTGTIKKSQGVYGFADRGQLIVKVDSSLSTIEMQTTIGNRTNRIDISPTAFLVDHCDNIYLSGWGSDVRDFNPGSTLNLPITNDALQKTTDGNDFYLIALSKDAGSLVYATFFGGDSSKDHVDGGTSRFDKKGVVYQAVCASCPERANQKGFNDFPVTSGAAFEKNISPRCSNASFKIDFRLSNPVVASFISRPPRGCAPLLVRFENKSIGASRYKWYFGDGDSSSLQSPFHMFRDTGTFKVVLVAYNPDACNQIDSAVQYIQVYNYSTADFTFDTIPCKGLVTFKNKGVNAFKNQWFFGDGKRDSSENPTHLYHASGSYPVTLITENLTGCADTITKMVQVDIRDSLKASFLFNPPGACAPAEIAFTNTSDGGTTFYWDMGDGGTYTQKDVTHTYWLKGNYTVRLIAEDDSRCNTRDTATAEIEVYEEAIAAFVVNNTPCTREVITENFSLNGKVVEWDWGDGTTSYQTPNDTHVYAQDGQYTIVLRINPGTTCYDSMVLGVDVQYRDTIEAAFTAEPDSACAPALVEFMNQSTGGKTYTWEFGNGNTENSYSPLQEYKNPGRYLVILSVEDKESCNQEDRDSLWITIGSPTKSAFAFEKAPCTNEFKFINQSGENARYFFWEFVTGQQSTERDPMFLFEQSGDYTVRLIAMYDSICPDTSEQTISIDRDAAGELIIPNVFTPNNDGKNDCYRLGGLSAECDEIKWVIYNRWGEKVFESNDNKACWDGTNTFTNIPMPEGVYYSIIDIHYSQSGLDDLISGTITLIRDASP